MNIKQDFTWVLSIGALCIILFIFQYSRKHTEPDALFYTERAQRRSISSVIDAKGILLPDEIVKVGNLINGIIRYLYVDENDFIQEGQLVAEIDDSLEDTAVNNAFGNLDAAQAALKYQLEFLKRQEQLYGCKQISLDAYQQAERSYQDVFAKVEATKGLYESAKLVYDNKRVRSPVSGMVIARRISVGEAVSNLPPETILFLIAKNVQHLQAHIILDDKSLEIVRPNLTAYMTTLAHPHHTFSGPINVIKNMSHYMQSSDYVYTKIFPSQNAQMHPCAIVPIENHDLLLKPGMTLSARIIVDQKADALCIPQQALAINIQTIELLAHKIGYNYHAVTSKIDNEKTYAAPKTIWVVERKTFVQKEVSTGLSDGDFVEITHGLHGSEEIICRASECFGVKNLIT